MPTLFTRIIEGELPGHFVWRDPRCVAFLSIEPLAPGHTLVVPREPLDHWLDLPDELAAHLNQVARRVGRGMMAAFQPTKVGLIIAGLEVPHVHLHVVPIRDLGDLSFANADRQPRPAALDAAADQLRAALSAQGCVEASD